ncbi:MAG TPA: VOC family protein [Segetibacter sp.]|jgi:predicted 3-demethylubiquinone-9 3-methyltransferase (glyoxalase superfamily)
MNNQIFPCLWFDGQAKEAATFYCSVFDESRITADTPMVVNFELSGQKFMGLNGGPHYKLNPSISFFMVCETEGETNAVWSKLLEGGGALMPLNKYDWSERYGWLQDRFGVSWQISLGKMEDVGQKFTPSLLFVGEQHGKAEQALNFYTSVFKDSNIEGVLRYGAGESDPEGTVKHAQFTVNNYVMMVMDSSYAHQFSFNEAISFVVTCENQEEIDYYWNKLTEGGQESRCGWLKDQFGVSWQVVPVILGKLMSDHERSGRVVQAFMQMKKLDIKILEEA